MLDLAIQQARVQQQQQAQRLTDGHNQPIPEDVDWEVQELRIARPGRCCFCGQHFIMVYAFGVGLSTLSAEYVIFLWV